MEVWNHHRGDECPVPPDMIVEVTNELGETLVARAGDLYWSQGFDIDGRIVMWRRAAAESTLRRALLAAFDGSGSVMPRVLVGRAA